MRKVHIDSLGAGVKLAKTVFSPDGKVLLSSGTELKKKYIDKLRLYRINELYIEDDISAGIEFENIVREETRLEAKTLVKKLIDGYVYSDSIDIGQVKETVNKIIDELLLNRDILVNLSNMKSVDDYTFEHSVNVCILSLVIGIGMGYGKERLRDLVIGAMLHDIGKLKIPEEILKKPSRLTMEEFEEIKKHTLYGYEILKNNQNVSMVSAFIAFGHHERFDGSGYPLQLKGDNIHHCARIVAVADVFDALTSDRVYRHKLCPHDVFDYITSLRHHHFDKDVVSSFTACIAVYPVGTGVLLSSGERGIVCRENKAVPMRPVVRVIYNERGEKLKEFYEIDLANKMSVHIADYCEI